MDAKKLLTELARLEVQIRGKLAEVQRWKELARQVTADPATVRVRSSPSGDGLARAVAGCVDAQTELEDQLRQLRGRQAWILARMELLQNPTHYEVLHMRFLRGWSIQQVAEHFDHSNNWASQTQARALAQLQGILDREAGQGLGGVTKC